MFRSVKQLQSLSEGLTLKLLHACRHIVHASEVLFLSERYAIWVNNAAPSLIHPVHASSSDSELPHCRWLACTTLEKFTATVNGLRHAHRECLIGLLNALASEDGEMPQIQLMCYFDSIH